MKAKMFVPDYFWTEPKIGQHEPAIFGGKQSGGSGNTDGVWTYNREHATKLALSPDKSRYRKRRD